MLRAASRLLTIAAIALPCIPGMARAQDSSAWDAAPHAAARLIAGAALRSADAAWLRAGIEIRLDTRLEDLLALSRQIPACRRRFDFAGSENVKSVTVLWPAPTRFADGAGGHSIGYQGDVVLPLRVLANDAAKPAALHLKLDYAVCSNLACRSKPSSTLRCRASAAPRRRRSLQRKRAFLPRDARRRQRRRRPRHSLGAPRTGRRGRAGLVDVAAPAGTPVDLFAEGPAPDWALPLPEASGGGAGTRRFTFDLDGLPPGAHVDGATLTLTATSPDDAIEVPVHLD